MTCLLSQLLRKQYFTGKQQSRQLIFLKKLANFSFLSCVPIKYFLLSSHGRYGTTKPDSWTRVSTPWTELRSVQIIDVSSQYVSSINFLIENKYLLLSYSLTMSVHWNIFKLRFGLEVLVPKYFIFHVCQVGRRISI